MKFRFKYSRFQEELIDLVKKHGIKCRIRKDRTIEYAKKHDGDIDNLVNEIRFSVFERPALRIWREDLDKKFFIEKLVEYNIPFFEEDHDGLTWFLHDYYDSEIIVKIEREIGLFDSLFSKLPDTQ